MNLRFADGSEQRIFARSSAPRPTSTGENSVDADAYAVWFLRAERHRADYARFGASKSHWLMLVDLWVAEAERHEVCTTSLCLAGGVPGTTGLRHIERLIEARMIVEERDPRDNRRRLFRLSPDGRAVVEEQLAAEAALMASMINGGGKDG